MSAENHKSGSKRALAARLKRLARATLGTTHGRLVVVTLVALVAVAYAARVIWRDVGPNVLAGDDYQLTAERIDVTPPPAWIRSDVKAEVVRDASLDRALSILAPDLTERVAAAFKLHPWVEKVTRVSKHYPARVRVEVVYRRPVAMVEFDTDGARLLPVDAHGVALPGRDFSPVEAATYPRITQIGTVPLGPSGTPWGDERVEGAAKIGAALREAWETLQLDRIVPVAQGVNDDGHDRPVYELVTRGLSSGPTRIIWGHAPGQTVTGEMSAAEKVTRLTEYADRHGSLDEPDDGHELDLRDRGNIVRRRQAARRDPSP